MGFHNKGLPLLVKGKSGGCGVGVNSEKDSSETQDTTDSAQGRNQSDKSTAPAAAGGNSSRRASSNNKKGGNKRKRAPSVDSGGTGVEKDLNSKKDKEMTMIEKKIKIIEDLEAFQQALPLFSSMEHHAVHIAISEEGEPTLFECVCGEEVLKEIQFLRHLLYELGALDLRSLSYFVKSKIETLTGKPQGKGKDQSQKKNEKNGINDSQLPSTSSSCNLGNGHVEEMETDEVAQPSLVHQSEENQDLVEKVEVEEPVAGTSQSQASSSKKGKKKKKAHGHHRSHEKKVKKSGHEKKQKLRKKNPKNFYWQKRNGHGIKVKIQAGENEGKYVCYCGNIFQRLSSIDHHVNKKWNKRDFKCEEDGCDQVYQSKFRLKLHFQKNHMSESESSSQPDAAPVYSIAAVSTPTQEKTSSTPAATKSSPSSAKPSKPAPKPKAAPPPSKKKVAKLATKKKTPAIRVSARRKIIDSTKEASAPSSTPPNSSVTPAPEAAGDGPKKIQLTCPREGCGKKFITKKGMRLHVQAQHDKIPVICKRCGMDVKYETCLLVHQRLENFLENYYH